jgi:hypothetical protein
MIDDFRERSHSQSLPHFCWLVSPSCFDAKNTWLTRQELNNLMDLLIFLLLLNNLINLLIFFICESLWRWLTFNGRNLDLIDYKWTLKQRFVFVVILSNLIFLIFQVIIFLTKKSFDSCWDEYCLDFKFKKAKSSEASNLKNKFNWRK